VTPSVTWPLDSLVFICDFLLVVVISTNRLSRTVFETLCMQRCWGHDLNLFGVTWRHRLRDHWTRKLQFPIGSQYELAVYLSRLLRYWASKILGSRRWPFRVTWRHQPRDHWTHNIQFPIGDLFILSLYLASLLRYYMWNTNAGFLKLKLSRESRVITGTRNSSVLTTANRGLSSE